MWTLFIILSLWALHCSVFASPPKPINVRFSSVNLRNVLHWVQGNDSTEEIQYTVEYAIYGDSTEGSKGRRVRWRAVQHCTKIVRTWCDLSKETEDEEEGYYARVRAVHIRASSKWALTQRRFDPKSDTSFGPPLVTVDIEHNTAIITLAGPMRSLLRKNSSVISMGKLYPQMAYNLSINNTNRNQTHHFLVASSPYKYHLMDFNTVYCFSARSKFLNMPVECQVSAWHCITTPPDPVVEKLKIVLGIFIPVLCLCVIAVVGYILYRYLTGDGQTSPYTLKPPFSHPSSIIVTPEIFSDIQINPKDALPSHSFFSQGQQCMDGPPPKYSLQCPRAFLNPEELGDEIDYGFVSQAHKRTSDGEKEDDKKGDKDDRFQGEECRVINDQETSYRTQTATHTCKPTYMPTGTPVHTHNVLRPLLQTIGLSDLNPHIPAVGQSLLQGFQGSNAEKESETEKISGLSSIKNVQKNLFFIGSVKKGAQMNGKEKDEMINGEVPEKARLLCAYVFENQNCSNSEVLPDDYGELGFSETNGAEWPCGQDENQHLNNCGLRLESVYVRQGSEEEAEGRREKESRGETGWGIDDVFEKWNLVIANE